MSKLERLIDELCPDGVEYKTLSDILKIKNGKDYKQFKEGNIPVYGSGGIMTYIDTFVLNKPSVLIPRKGSIDKLYYVEEPFWTVDTIFYTEIYTDIVIPKFVFYYLQKEHLEQYNTAGGVPSLTQGVLNKISFPIPPLPVQEEIVRILDTFTELTAELTMRKKQYEYYRDSFFKNNIPNRKLKDIVDIYLGVTYKPTYVENGIKFISSQNISNDYLDLSNIKYISQEEYNKTTQNAKPKRGDILFTRVGSNLGHPVIVDVDFELCIFVSLGYLRIKDEKQILNSYIKYWMNTELFWEQVRKNVHGSAKVNLNTGWLKEFDIFIPPLEEQQHIVDILDRFDTLVNDIKTGLPVEIEARKQQYEYYRDKLLTFKRLKIKD